MADDKLDQLLELQRQLMAAKATAEASPAEEADASVEMEDWLQELDRDAVVERLREQFGAFLDGLDTDLKDTRPSTILLLLGAGFLMGRLSK